MLYCNTYTNFNAYPRMYTIKANSVPVSCMDFVVVQYMSNHIHVTATFIVGNCSV
jgi:hypothetical protein